VDKEILPMSEMSGSQIVRRTVVYAVNQVALTFEDGFEYAEREFEAAGMTEQAREMRRYREVIQDGVASLTDFAAEGEPNA
jgi:hypothetical protein